MRRDPYGAFMPGGVVSSTTCLVTDGSVSKHSFFPHEWSYFPLSTSGSPNGPSVIGPPLLGITGVPTCRLQPPLIRAASSNDQTKAKRRILMVKCRAYWRSPGRTKGIEDLVPAPDTAHVRQGTPRPDMLAGA
jgi:hypothetical protein